MPVNKRILRKIKAPRIVNNLVTQGGLIGNGRSGEVFKGEIRNLGVVGKVWNSAIKVPFSELTETRSPPTREDIIGRQKVWGAFKQAGLPVAGYHKIDLRKELVGGKVNPYYLSTFMPNMEAKKKLQLVHDAYGRPVFLSRLSVSQDRKLIKSLAKDLATIHSVGFAFKKYVDFWHFYPKGKTFGRVILDFEEFAKNMGEKKCVENVIVVLNYLKPTEGQYFAQRYFAECKNPRVREELKRVLIDKDHANYIPRGV
ncbi:MAG: hypothetical protein WCW13_04895 [archaeon]|jgi:hypothetical protein